MKHGKCSWLLAVLLATALVLAGCGNKAHIGGSVTPIESTTGTETTETKAPGTDPTETTATEPDPTETEATEPEAPTEFEGTEQDEHPLSLGRLEGGIYTNTYAGFGCELDSSWTFYSAEELQDIPSSVKDAISGSELGDCRCYNGV